MNYCPNCKENSVVSKVYSTQRDSKTSNTFASQDETRRLRRVRYCINKGCGYTLELPPLVNGKPEFLLSIKP